MAIAIAGYTVVVIFIAINHIATSMEPDSMRASRRGHDVSDEKLLQRHGIDVCSKRTSTLD